ncbi:ABC-type multidrug transport system fused ATPase/permease subunit [Clostridium punense]|uniref:ABC-type multidrug transport system fused ATPase/permease subunit n=1 Tax=Clostridium punense TaxID=1054297 RepID=A0ABS4K774_9CLOT|nr:ABC transporter ATP-binding protein [Clostridium punense]MBP2023642.1 ABC-type multidrug transport system fused ATPase/permease subunit [Clostridium punense]
MKVSLKEYLNLLSKYLKSQINSVIILATVLAGNIILQLANPQILRYFLDEATKGDTARRLTIAAIIFIGAAILQQGFNLIATYLSQNIGWRATNGLRVDLIEHCINLDMEFHKAHQPGELIERIDGDVNALFNFFSKFILNVLTNGVLLMGILLLLLREDLRIGLSLGVFAIAALCILWYLQSTKVDSWVIDRDAYGKLYGFIGEQITSTEDIRSSGAKNYVMNRFYDMLRKLLPITTKAVMNYYNMWSATLIIFTLGNVIAFGLSAYLFKKGVITIGTVYLIFSYTELLARPIEQIRQQLQDLQKAGASITRVKELLGTKSKIYEGESELTSSGSIEVNFDNVSFSYEEDSQVLKDICVQVPKGKILGVLGHTGSGKTTLAKLLVRLYDVDSGKIYLNNCSIEELTFKELRDKIAYVTQEVQLFQASVRDNLTMFNKNVKDEEILKVLYDVGLNQWYEGLSDGLGTVLQAGGGGLSAGEAQLLAFVRVFLKNPELVILDEATSRLDPITEQLIERALDKLLKNRTCIIIAHRLWTVQRADNIVILDKGTVIEQGQRESLAQDPQSKFYNLLQKGIEEVLV